MSVALRIPLSHPYPWRIAVTHYRFHIEVTKRYVTILTLRRVGATLRFIWAILFMRETQSVPKFMHGGDSNAALEIAIDNLTINAPMIKIQAHRVWLIIIFISDIVIHISRCFIMERDTNAIKIRIIRALAPSRERNIGIGDPGILHRFLDNTSMPCRYLDIKASSNSQQTPIGVVGQIPAVDA